MNFRSIDVIKNKKLNKNKISMFILRSKIREKKKLRFRKRETSTLKFLIFSNFNIFEKRLSFQNSIVCVTLNENILVKKKRQNL